MHSARCSANILISRHIVCKHTEKTMSINRAIIWHKVTFWWRRGKIKKNKVKSIMKLDKCKTFFPLHGRSNVLTQASFFSFSFLFFCGL